MIILVMIPDFASFFFLAFALTIVLRASRTDAKFTPDWKTMWLHVIMMGLFITMRVSMAVVWTQINAYAVKMCQGMDMSKRMQCMMEKREDKVG